MALMGFMGGEEKRHNLTCFAEIDADVRDQRS
jgi:hypothetical protein